MDEKLVKKLRSRFDSVKEAEELYELYSGKIPKDMKPNNPFRNTSMKLSNTKKG